MQSFFNISTCYFASSDMKTGKHIHKSKTLPDPPLPRNITLLSYNIFMRPLFVKNNEDDYKNERLKQFIGFLPRFDIICLQEMFGLLSFRKRNLIEKAKHKGFLFSTESPSPTGWNGQIVDGGLLILSKFPIVQSEFFEYPKGIYSDALCCKGVLYAKIQVNNNQILHIFNTHAQASYKSKNEVRKEKSLIFHQKMLCFKRLEQFLSLRMFIERCLRTHEFRKDDKVLITGDFNVNAHAEPFKTNELLEHHLYRPYLTQNCEFVEEYQLLINILSKNNRDRVQDLVKATYGYHPVTYGDSFLDDGIQYLPVETTLTMKEDLCSNQTLDYIFELIPNYDEIVEKPKLQPTQIKILDKSARVEKFFVTDKKYTQLSDHYGLLVELEYYNDYKQEMSLIEELKKPIQG